MLHGFYQALKHEALHGIVLILSLLRQAQIITFFDKYASNCQAGPCQTFKATTNIVTHVVPMGTSRVASVDGPALGIKNAWNIIIMLSLGFKFLQLFVYTVIKWSYKIFHKIVLHG